MRLVAPPRRATRPRAFALSLALALAAALAVAGCTAANDRTARVTVPQGASFNQVADSLTARGVVRSRLLFKLRARLAGVDRQVRAGVYEFPPHAPMGDVLAMLAGGKVVAERFTVPEGFSIFEIAALARERLGMPVDSFLVAARDTAAADSMGLPGPTFEGYLWPDTYLLPPDIGARELVRHMAQRFRTAWRPEWTAQLDSVGLSQREAVTLASIVEGEARVDSERTTIAGVYLNRLRRGMPLQADPTVQYAIALRQGRKKPRLYEKDYLTPSEYNTYQHPGFPPGPVNNPGASSIAAALHPARVPYLYFVASPDGHHTFTSSYDQHLRAVARARRAARDTPPGGR
ncbi:MAG TPA: endolytic transglycosylase MltG [Gemmatimonadales bacterium]|nr:endolytic transglycosylase MltG [Gemmatimonadales bacterium]